MPVASAVTAMASSMGSLGSVGVGAMGSMLGMANPMASAMAGAMAGSMAGSMGSSGAGRERFWQDDVVRGQGLFLPWNSDLATQGPSSLTFWSLISLVDCWLGRTRRGVNSHKLSTTSGEANPISPCSLGEQSMLSVGHTGLSQAERTDPQNGCGPFDFPSRLPERGARKTATQMERQGMEHRYLEKEDYKCRHPLFNQGFVNPGLPFYVSGSARHVWVGIVLLHLFPA